VVVLTMKSIELSVEMFAYARSSVFSASLLPGTPVARANKDVTPRKIGF